MISKENLHKHNVRNASAISKIKIDINEYPSQTDYNNPKKLNTQIEQIFKSMNNYNAKNKSYSVKLLKTTGSNIAKENIILSLRKDLDFHRGIKKDFMAYKRYSTDVYCYFKKNYEEILKYKDNLAEDLKDFVKVINKYEETITQYKKEKIMIIKTNEDIIKLKMDEREKLNQRLKKLNFDLENQNNKLQGLKNTISDYEKQNKNYINDLNKNELNHVEKYEILEEAYNNLLKRYNQYQETENRKRKLQLDEINENLCVEEECKADLKLQDNLIKNIFLKNIVDDIKKQMRDVEILNQQYKEDQKLLKFLGKTFYNKLKQRKLELVDNQFSNEGSSKTNKNKIQFSTTSSM